MSDVIEYKCPFCGGAMEFDSKSQHMKCLYCNTEMTVEEFQRTQKPEAETAAEKKTAKENWFSLSSGNGKKMRQIICVSIPASPAVVKLWQMKQQEPRPARSVIIK